MRTASEDQSLFLYEEVAKRITQQIQRGAFKPGERIPSVRTLKTKLGLSLSTVLEAYRRLEDSGMIEARPQSGFYVRLDAKELPPVPALTSPSSTATEVTTGELAIEVHENNLNPSLVPLGTAVPSDSLLPTNKLNRILRSVARQSEGKTSRYEPISGNADLRRHIAKRSINWGGHLTPEEIVITSGGTEALNLCLRATTTAGDTIAIESPTYYGVLQILESLKLKAIEVPTHPIEGISLEAIDSIIRRHHFAAVLVQPNLHNPLGCSMPEEKKRALVNMMAEHEIPLIEDDTYGDLSFDGRRPTLLKAFDKGGGVLSCLSFSKSLSPGFRLGWTTPGRYLSEVRRLKMTSSISSATLPQMVLAEMIGSSDFDRYLRNVRRIYKTNMDRMIDAVRSYFPEGTKVTRPSGGIVVWVEFPRAVDSMVLYRKALAKNISVLPGPLFSAKRQYESCIRLNCGHPWSEQIEKAMITLGHITNTMIERGPG